MVHARRVFLVIAMLCGLVVGVCDVLVISAMDKLSFEDGFIEALKQSIDMDTVQTTLNVELSSVIIMTLIVLLAMIFLFADKKAKQKILGVGWLCLMSIFLGCSINAFVDLSKFDQTAISDLKYKLILLLVADILALFLIIVGLVNCEKQLKAAKAVNTMQQ